MNYFASPTSWTEKNQMKVVRLLLVKARVENEAVTQMYIAYLK